MISVLSTASSADVEGVLRILAAITDPEKHKAALQELIDAANKVAEMVAENSKYSEAAAEASAKAAKDVADARELTQRAERLHLRREAEFNARNSALDQLSRRLNVEKEALSRRADELVKAMETREREVLKRETAIVAREQRLEQREGELHAAEQQYAQKHGELQRALSTFRSVASSVAGTG